MLSKEQRLLEEAYEKVLNEFLGFGKKEEAPAVGVKFANMLVKGLLAKGFKQEKIEGGFKFKKTNKLGTHLIFTFGGGEDKYKETPVSILFKVDKPSDMIKDLYKTYNFPTIDLRVDPQDYEKVKKKHAEKEEHEERQRQKVSQIYDTIAAFDSDDLAKVKELMQ
jgi:hypothetical protein